MALNKLIYTICSAIVLVHFVKCLSFEEDLDNFINPLDIDVLSDIFSTTISPTTYNSNETTERSTSTMTSIPSNQTHNVKVPSLNLTESSDCFGLGSITGKLRWFINLRPQHSEEIEVEFFIHTRRQKERVQVLLDDQFGLEWTYFDPQKNTVIIVHGFLSYSKASWVVNMTKAFLEWDDVNVITVDWSKGGNTWKYWRAVANTRTVGTDLARFMKQIIRESGTNKNKFHFIGHSLGAHICSYAANLLGGVRRITGLDPAQPCFITTDLGMLLDNSDADFVDVIHTNGRELSKFGLGLSNASGDQDFYPNGGKKQPGCQMGKSSFFNRYLPISKAKLKRAVCNHGRAHKLFTESLKNNSCSLIGHKWNMSYNSINSSINEPCTDLNCAELGIRADQYSARGAFYVVTTEKKPFCEMNPIKVESRFFLLSDHKESEEKDRTTTAAAPEEMSTTSKGRRWYFFG